MVTDLLIRVRKTKLTQAIPFYATGKGYDLLLVLLKSFQSRN